MGKEPNKIHAYMKEQLKSCFSAWLFMMKLTIPAMVLARLLLYFDLVPYLSTLFRPLMALVGLPGEAALVWVTGMLANLYVAVAVFVSLIPVMEPLTVAQATALGAMGLLAHGLLIEGQICRAAGLSFWRVTMFRIFAAMCFGVFINLSNLATGWGAEPARVLEILNMAGDPVPPWGLWLVSVAKQCFLILALMLVFMLILDIFKAVGLTRLLMIVLGPPLRLAGVSEAALMVTIIGCVAGFAYGCGLILAESRSGRIPPRDIFGAMMLMSIFHSLFEDTLVMWTMGGSIWWLLGGRAIFGLGLSGLAARLIKRPMWHKILVGNNPDLALRPEGVKAP
ncbi:hypothetical protein LJB99_03255 [Deltaproteobacteria bacterium OttesenSCG-928-K17]|nr:hypothetical protein [Deltaproteobacteria bacterium OttesenSCG-928-K17]